MKAIEVSCAVISKNGKILCAKRSAKMSMPGVFEFPGGKIEMGENPVDALEREILEELSIEIIPVKELPVVNHCYKDQTTITLYPFLCLWQKGELKLTEHEEVQFMTWNDFDQLNWAEADIPVYRDLQERKAYYLSVLDAFQLSQ